MTQAADATAPALLAQRFVEALNARDQQAPCKLYHPNARIKQPTWPREGELIIRSLAARTTCRSRPIKQEKHPRQDRAVAVLGRDRMAPRHRVP